jgi:hypothetical protein
MTNCPVGNPYPAAPASPGSFSIFSSWTILFTQWGLLAKDQQIGTTMHALGWLGMLATIAWLAYHVWSGAKERI